MARDSTITLGVSGFCFNAIVGVHPVERQGPQPLEADVSVDVILKNLDDTIQSTFDYSLIPDIVLKAAQREPRIIETLASDIAEMVLSEDARITKVEIEVRKPHAIKDAKASFVRMVRVRSSGT